MYGIRGISNEGMGRMTMKGNSVIAAQGTNGSVTLMHNVLGDNVRVVQPEGAVNKNGYLSLDGKIVTAWVYIVSSSKNVNPYDVNQDRHFRHRGHHQRHCGRRSINIFKN